MSQEASHPPATKHTFKRSFEKVFPGKYQIFLQTLDPRIDCCVGIISNHGHAIQFDCTNGTWQVNEKFDFDGEEFWAENCTSATFFTYSLYNMEGMTSDEQKELKSSILDCDRDKHSTRETHRVAAALLTWLLA